jgi:hypothetical protein
MRMGEIGWADGKGLRIKGRFCESFCERGRVARFAVPESPGGPRALEAGGLSLCLKAA